MIDIENKVFNDIATVLRTTHSGISVYGEYIDTPSSFPCVTLVEDDNYTHKESQDTDLHEHNVNVSYTANIYSNKVNGKKAEAKQIANELDNLMQSMNFTRTMRNQVPNIDRTIYRIVEKYQAVVGEPIIDLEHSSITYPIYRR